MDASNRHPPNPYVGPRSFQQGERIYGRDREANELLNLIIAERIVLLHSPSGAGKTSLVHAALIPRLLSRRFDVLPVVRLNLESAAGARRGGQNRYVLSAIASLQETGSTGASSPGREPASLAEFLAERSSQGDGRFEILIFDQFEEILTLDPTDRDAKREFFSQVGEALRDTNRWALFSMRDDFVAALKPYLLPIPNRFNTTFRLDLLGPEAAALAIQQPALEAGVEFEDDAAQQLIDDLRRVQVQQPDGTLEPQPGLHVEPVQLQVVCYRLWESAATADGAITQADLARFGQVDQSLVDESLAGYYAESVSQAIAGTEISERAVREWFDRHLITELGVRGTVLRGPDRSEGLDNTVIQRLVDSHLVRGDSRGGATWFELAHDRLIGPVRASNRVWFKANLSLVQEQAGKWDATGRPESLLLRKDDLRAAEEWAGSYDGELLAVEEDYLSAGRRLAARERRASIRNRLIAVLAVVSIILAGAAYLAWQEAKDQELLAQAGRSDALAQLSKSLVDSSPSLSMLLAIENLDSTAAVFGTRSASAEEALRAGLSSPRGIALPGHEGPVDRLALSPAEDWLATAGPEQTRALLWDISDSTADPIVLDHEGTVTALVFGPGGRRLATGSADTQVRIWDVAQPAQVQILDHGRAVRAVALTEDWIASAGTGTFHLWRPAGGNGAPVEHELELPETSGVTESVTLSPDGTWLAAGFDNRVIAWDLRDPFPRFVDVAVHSNLVTAVVFSSDGSWLASGSDDGGVMLAAVSDAGISSPEEMVGHTDGIRALAFGGHHLAAGSKDSTARVWDLNDVPPTKTGNPRVLTHPDWVNALAFAPNSEWLLTGSGDGAARTWRLADPVADAGSSIENAVGTLVLEDGFQLRGHEQAVLAVAAGERWLATSSDDGFVRLFELAEADEVTWLLADPMVDPIVVPGPGASTFAAADGVLAGGGGSGPARLWSWTGDSMIPVSGPSLRDGAPGEGVGTIALSRDGRWLAIGAESVVTLWDLDDANPTPTSLPGHAGQVRELIFDGDGHWLVTRDPAVTRLWDLRTGGTAPSPTPLTVDGDSIRTAAFHPSLPLLVTGSASGDVRRWDLTPGGHAPELIGTVEDFVDDLVFNDQGDTLAVVGRRTTWLWDWDVDAAIPGELAQLAPDVTAAAFSRSGAWLATGTRNGTLDLWDLSAADPIVRATDQDHDGPVGSLAFSDSGDWLAATSDDEGLRLWGVDGDGFATGPVSLQHPDRVEPLDFAFSPDEAWIVTLASDGNIRLWRVSVDELINQACVIVGRNLTAEESSRFFPGEPYRTTCEDYPPPTTP